MIFGVHRNAVSFGAHARNLKGLALRLSSRFVRPGVSQILSSYSSWPGVQTWCGVMLISSLRAERAVGRPRRIQPSVRIYMHAYVMVVLPLMLWQGVGHAYRTVWSFVFPVSPLTFGCER